MRRRVGLFLCAMVMAAVLTACTSHTQLLRKAQEETRNCPPLPVVQGSRTYDLALSGGGYRAMLFHVGALWRLHELGILQDVETISSVSGGSITAGVLALQLDRIQSDVIDGKRTDCFRKLVAEPLVQLAQTTIDDDAIFQSLVSPKSAGNVLEAFYRGHLFGDARMGETPASPAFVFQATNLHTGSVWSFSRDWMGDPQVLYADSNDVPLSSAVAASSSFPPVLSPFLLDGKERSWIEAPHDAAVSNSREAGDAGERERGGGIAAVASPEVLASLRERVLLTDGGVADNLAIEGIWYSRNTLLISDGGANPIAVEDPPTNWLGQLVHIIELIHAQPAQLRYRSLLDGFRALRTEKEARDGAYWALGKALPCHWDVAFSRSVRADPGVIKRLSSVSTRLAALTVRQAHELINLGYHLTDWSLPYIDARWAEQKPQAISEILPYPHAALWAKDQPQRGCGLGSHRPPRGLRLQGAPGRR